MKFIKNNCLLCEEKTEVKHVYSQNLPKKIVDVDYSGRKKPDNFHYEMVRCLRCGLLFASEIYDNQTITDLYKDSEFEYFQELDGLVKTYSSLFKYISFYNVSKDNFLDIGCANGFLIKEAKKFGFANVNGSEISLKAINSAHKSVKDSIMQGPFNQKNYSENFFDVVFFAMIIEHFENPNKFLKDVYKILKPGGLLIGITHDEKNFLSRLLKNKHPIINDEHISVFDKMTLKNIIKKNNFEILNVENLKNYYSIEYWLMMTPIYDFIKKISLSVLKLLKLNKKIIGVKAGNIYIIARK